MEMEWNKVSPGKVWRRRAELLNSDVGKYYSTSRLRTRQLKRADDTLDNKKRV
jgi:hypothetical protein